MYICEFSFETEDGSNPGYSHHEVDYYAWIPTEFHKEVPNHRLSLRKNLVEDKFEVYRFYVKTLITKLGISQRKEQGYLIMTTPRGDEEVAFSGDFLDALEFANNEYAKYHGKEDRDKPCKHKYPEASSFCPMRYSNE